MSSSLYSAVASSDAASSPIMSRWNSLGSWTNPFLSRFPSLSTSIGTLKRGLSSRASPFVRTPSTTEPRVTQNDVKYDLARPEDKQEEEETVGLVSSPPPPSSTTGQNPFDDSHAVSTKPFWHRAIVAGVILAALIGVGLALGLGVKKIAGKVADIEAERAQSSLASIRSLHSPTSLSSTSSSPATPSPAATSSVLTLVATTPPSTTSPSSTPGSGSIRLDDISWAVPKTVR